MRVATIILPNDDNNGNDISDVHAAMQTVLVDTFGGFTATASNGAWRDDKTGKIHVEPGQVYYVAMDDTAENRAKLESIALFYGHMANQIAMMVTHANGEVTFVDCEAKAYA